MKFLIIGAGSIGKRHAKNILSLGHQVTICDPKENILKDSQLTNKINFYKDYKQALKDNEYDNAVIASPSNLHITHAIDIAHYKINIFMEKPLSHNLEKTKELDGLIKKNKLIFMMAQSYRFHEGFLEIKKLIDDGVLGKIYNVEMFGGLFLPDWHYKEDYRNEYAANKNLGGGVLLTSLSHSVDTIRWLFDEIIHFYGWKTKLSDLDIDVEDFTSCLFLTKKNIVVNVIEDFLSRFPKNQIRIHGSNGYLESDFIKNQIKVWTTLDRRFVPNLNSTNNNYYKVLEDGIAYNPETEVINYKFEPNKRYYDEIKFFIQNVKSNNYDIRPNFDDGIKVLKILCDNQIKNLNNDKT
tara:strand:+ start:10290 stop:11348 length:1059 start_codon:yes stop_codon:yes gene_type:complete